MTVSSSAFAATGNVTSVDLLDQRKEKQAGYDYIYEARNAELTENVRNGRTQARQNLDIVKARVKVRLSPSRMLNPICTLVASMLT